MDRYPKKPCKYCGSTNHFPHACWHNPKAKERSNRPLSTTQKTQKAWLQTRETWIKKNPPTVANKYWKCYLGISPQCRNLLDEKTITLDHVVSRSRDPSKRHDLSNLRPCCWFCNNMKGSSSLDALERMYGVKIDQAPEI